MLYMAPVNFLIEFIAGYEYMNKMNDYPVGGFTPRQRLFKNWFTCLLVYQLTYNLINLSTSQLPNFQTFKLLTLYSANHHIKTRQPVLLPELKMPGNILRPIIYARLQRKARNPLPGG